MNLEVLRSAIRGVPIIRALPEPVRERVGMMMLWLGERRVAGDGESLYTEGMRDEETGCVLLAGQVKVNRADGLDEAVEAPELLGEIQQFTEDKHRTATVTAMGQTELLTFQWQDLADLAGYVLNAEERTVFQSWIAQLAWARCDALFDEAAKRAQQAQG